MKKTLIYLLAAFLLFSCLFFTGCGNKPTAGEAIESNGDNVNMESPNSRTTQVTVYYADKNGYIVPVQTNIDWSEGIAKAVIRKMMNTPELQQQLVTMGLESLLPPEAAINGIDITEGLAKIDFATSALTLPNKKAEENFVQGVVLALTAFPTVEKVQFMFNGYVLETLEHGTEVSLPLSPADFNVIRSDNSGKETVCVYMHGTSEEHFNYYVPITAYAAENDCSTAMDLLMHTKVPELTSSIPENCTLTSIELIDNTLCLFFNDAFTSLAADKNAEAAAVRSIALTCAQYYPDTRIKLYAGNKEYLPTEGIDIPTFSNMI